MRKLRFNFVSVEIRVYKLDYCHYAKDDVKDFTVIKTRLVWTGQLGVEYLPAWLLGQVCIRIHDKINRYYLSWDCDDMKNDKLTISVIGVGNMGSAIVKGLVRSSVTIPENIRIFDPDASKMATLQSELGVVISDSIKAAVGGPERVILIAVKPQIINGVLDSMAGLVQSNTVVISIAAGISTTQLLERLGNDKRVIRAMPNAAAMIGHSATAICKAGMADYKDVEVATGLFNAVGSTVYVDEKNINAVTALSGSGPGYLFVIMEAMTDAGVLMGLPRDVARELTVHTVYGSACMAQQGKSFSDLKDMITSPGGTTIHGLKVMERAGVRGVLMETVAAAAYRADELSK